MLAIKINDLMYSLPDGYVSVEPDGVLLNGEPVSPSGAAVEPGAFIPWVMGSFRFHVRDGKFTTKAA